MAFRTGSDQQRAYNAAKNTARSLRQYCVDFNALAAAENVSGNLVLELRTRLIADNAVFDEVKNVPGIAAYAQDIEDDSTYDVAAEFTTMHTEVADAIGWISANYPADANGWLQHEQLTGTGTDVRAFSPAQTAGLRTEVQDVIDAIEEPLTALSG